MIKAIARVITVLVVLFAASVHAQWITPDAKRLTLECRAPATSLSYQVRNTFPHDVHAFTQGLVIHGGRLFEGTGRRGHSDVREVELETGKVLRRVRLPRRYFGEGLTVLGNSVIQLTWQAGRALVYRIEDFGPTAGFEYRGEGWGLTHDGERLYMSDGQSALRVIDAQTYLERRRIRVMESRNPIRGLNELEYVDGFVLANVWRTQRIAVIAPDSGRVCAWIHLDGLLQPAQYRAAGVLNGIAYDDVAKRLYVTGKLWPNLFEMVVTPMP